jgi:hypothetical protein
MDGRSCRHTWPVSRRALEQAIGLAERSRQQMMVFRDTVRRGSLWWGKVGVRRSGVEHGVRLGATIFCCHSISC